MQNHIQLTIADINNRIESLNLLVAQLRDLERTTPGTPILEVLDAPEGGKLPPLNGTKLRQAPARKTAPAKSSRSPHGSVVSQNIVAIVAGMAEPFSSADISKAAGTSSKNAGNYVYRWTKKKWLTRVGEGAYQRTAKFPAAFPVQSATAAVQDPEPKPSRRHLENQLADTLKARDAANAAGLTSLAESHQRTIDRIESQLGN